MSKIIDLGQAPDNIKVVIVVDKVSYLGKLEDKAISLVIDGAKVTLNYIDEESRDTIFDAIRETMYEVK